eukprot:Tbor_TRINITY_DN5259_c0_g2::TRINITY_DN5259_c0_g2_i1::g.16404::m.16404/K09490/HSPA5, BIP; heat shock 70kDa protein 5
MKNIFYIFVLGVILIGGVSTADEKTIEPPCIGIDLGTTYSVVGVWQNGKVEIIPNEMGNRITPSVVGFTPDERLIGDAARNQIVENHANTVYAVKRLMGRQYNDVHVQKDLKVLSYEVTRDNYDRAAVKVNFKGEIREFKPEEISAMVLQKMKEISETYLNQKVTNAVVTVPAYFNDAQRQATKDAGAIAGLNVVRILNEPTAAAIAFGMDQGGQERKVLVFDLGGGTFDVSLLSIDGGFFEVEATNGDTHLGGEDFDNRIIEHFVRIISMKHNKDISNNSAALARLRKAAEGAKRHLSSQPEVRVEVDAIVEGLDISERLSRGKFEELCADLFKGTLEPVKAVLSDAQLDKEDVDEVVLVGGSTRIPKVQSLIKEFFNGKEPNRGINPDEAVAYGAAAHGGVLSGAKDLQGKVILVDVIPFSLGVEANGGVMLPIVPRNTIVPASKTQSVTTTMDDQDIIEFFVYEGERSMTKDNRLLGTFTLNGIKKAPRGMAKVQIKMDVDENGILHVQATDLDGGASESVEIANDKNKITQEEIDRMVEEAKTFEKADKINRERANARVALETLGDEYKLKSSKEEWMSQMTEEDQKTMETAGREATRWMDENSEATKEEIDAKRKDIEGRVDAIYKRTKSKVDAIEMANKANTKEKDANTEEVDDNTEEGGESLEDENDEF